MSRVGDSRYLWSHAAVAGLAVFCLAGATPPAEAPRLTVTLAPARADGAGTVSYVDVTVRSDAERVDPGRPLLRLARVISNVATVADKVEGLSAADAKGPLDLTAKDEQGAEQTLWRRWYANRPVDGQLTVHYRAPITNALNPRGPAPPLELRTEAGGFSGAGGAFLILPDTAAPHRLALHWDLAKLGPAAAGVSSLGAGDVSLAAAGGLARLDEAYFMGGAIRRYPDPPGDGPFFAAWQGDPPFDGRALMQWTQALYGHYLGFFKPPGTPPYGVFLRRNLINPGGGVELGGSFVGTFGADTQVQDLKLTLAHEMVHTFVGHFDGGDSLAGSWFSEGIAVYYQRVLPLRFGQISPDAFLADLNWTAGRYYTDLMIGAPNDQIPARFWADTRIRVLPYDRGSMYFAKVDEEVRKASHGARSLDDLILAMLDRRAHGQPMDQAAWVSVVTQALGSRGKAEFDAMLAGQVVLPPSDSFGPCFERTTAPLQRYELGFEPKVLTEPDRIVRDLITGSAAQRAGLRDGDRIAEPVGQDHLQGEQQAVLTLHILRDGQPLTIRYRPRGETVQAYQWKRVASGASPTCGAL